MNTKERNLKTVIVKFQQFLQRGEILDHNVVVAMTTIVMVILTNNSSVILVGTFHGMGFVLPQPVEMLILHAGQIEVGAIEGARELGPRKLKYDEN